MSENGQIWQENVERESDSSFKSKQSHQNNHLTNKISQNSNYSKNNVNNTTFFKCNINIFSTMDAFYRQKQTKSSKTNESNDLERKDGHAENAPLPRKTLRPRQSKSLNTPKLGTNAVFKKKERFAVKKEAIDSPIKEFEEEEFGMENYSESPFIIAEKSNFKNTFSSGSSLKLGKVDIPEKPAKRKLKGGSQKIEIISPCVDSEHKLDIPIPPKPEQSVINIEDIISEKSPSPTIQKESVSRYNLMEKVGGSEKTINCPPHKKKLSLSPIENPREKTVNGAPAKQQLPSSPTYPQLLLHPIPSPLIFSHRLAQDLLDSLKLSYSTPKNVKPVFMGQSEHKEGPIVFINSNSKSKNVPLEKYLNSISKCFRNMNFISNVDNLNSIEQVKHSIANMDMGQISKDLEDFKLLLTGKVDGTISGRLKDTFDRLDRLSKTASNLKPLLKKSSENYKVQIHNEPSTSDVKVKKRGLVTNSGEFYDSNNRPRLAANSSEKYRSEEDILIDFSDKNLSRTKGTGKSKREIDTGVFQIFRHSELEKDLLSEKKGIELGKNLFPRLPHESCESSATAQPNKLSFTVSNQKIIPQMASFSQNGIEGEDGRQETTSDRGRKVQINSFKDGEKTPGASTPREERVSLMDMVNQINILGSEIFKKKTRSENKPQLVMGGDAREDSQEINLECNELILPKQPEIILETSEPDFSTNQNQSSDSAPAKETHPNPSGMRPARLPLQEPKPQIFKNVFYDQSIISKATTFSEKENALLNKIKLDESKSNERHFLLTRKRQKGTFRKKHSFFRSPKHSLNPMMQFRKIKENCLTKCDLFLKKNKARRSENQASFAYKHERRKQSGQCELLFSGKCPESQKVVPSLSIEKSKGRGAHLSQTISENSEHLKIQSLADNLQSHKKRSKFNFFSNYQQKQPTQKGPGQLVHSKERKEHCETEQAPEPHIFSIDMTTKSSKKFSFKPKLSVQVESSQAKELCIYDRRREKKEAHLNDIYFTKNNFFKKKRKLGQAVGLFKNYSRKRHTPSVQNLFNFESQKNSPRNCLNLESFSGKNPPLYINPKFKKLNFSDQRMTLNENNNYTFCENDFKPNVKRKISDNVGKEKQRPEHAEEGTKTSQNGNLRMNQNYFQSFSNEVKEQIESQQGSSKKPNEYSSDFSNYIEFKSKQRGSRKVGNRKGTKARPAKTGHLFSHKGSLSKLSRNPNLKNFKRNSRFNKKFKGGLNHTSIRYLFKEKYSLRKMKSLEKV